MSSGYFYPAKGTHIRYLSDENQTGYACSGVSSSDAVLNVSVMRHDSER